MLAKSKRISKMIGAQSRGRILILDIVSQIDFLLLTPKVKMRPLRFLRLFRVTGPTNTKHARSFRIRGFAFPVPLPVTPDQNRYF
jgi:hypothetical protein